MAFDRDYVQQEAAKLAASGVYIGTSSWKYPGWMGLVYSESPYIWRGKFAMSRFEKNCLKEYAEIFKTVCVDAAYYSFPTVKYLEGMASLVPSDFRFTFKVTDAITLKRFPNLPRFGELAGKPNRTFLNGGVFERDFLKPCETIRHQIGILVFEFSRFYATDYAHGRDFIAELDVFLASLPKDWPYGVELRNRKWLQPEYFDCLHRHGVTHVFNSWTEMPTVSEQMALPGCESNPARVAARFLVKPGRTFEEAVNLFQPYGETKEINEDARKAGAQLIKRGKASTNRQTFLYAGNRLEGNSPTTIQSMIQQSAE